MERRRTWGDAGSVTGLSDDAKLDYEAVRLAVARHARVTPLIPAAGLSEQLGRPVFLKAECLQHTGSFKVRGAAARLEALSDSEREAGVVACSSGNHGRAVAFVAERMGVPATIYVPEWVDAVKLEGIEAAGAEARLVGATFDEAEAAAQEEARTTGRSYVSAYDDPWVIAGQGTLAAEITGQLGTPPAALVASLSGGGLLGGIAGAFRRARSGVQSEVQSDVHSGVKSGAGSGPGPGPASGSPSTSSSGASPTHCVAVSASNAAVMLASVRAGRPVELPEQDTLANALAGGIGTDNRYSFALVLDLVEEHAEVDERQIADGMRYALERLNLVVEGGGAVGLAALLAGAWAPSRELSDGPVVVLLTGGNVATATLLEVLATG